MCGIAGIISSDKRKIRRTELKLMGDCLAHRGPDDEGYLKLDHLGFVHKRLSIIDLVTGHQPMANEDQTVWIVYNGEIYNYIELRRELKERGHVFKTRSDTEVIIHLYEEFGEEAVGKLNGMFAFVIYDRKNDKVFAARDHFGIKPFYYIYNRNEFIFASEIKALLKVRPDYRKEDIRSLYEYISFQFCLNDKTFFEGVKKLLPGHYLILKNISRRPELILRKYWDIEFNLDRGRGEDYFSGKLSLLLKDAVRLQLRSDVPVGAHLSGGLDSSIITCLASRLSKAKIKTFTGVFDYGAEYDESKYAKLVSRFCGTSYFEVRPTPADFTRNISRIIYMMDEPVAGPGVFPQYLVSKLASEKVKVVLGGQGGDEIFGGYSRYLVAYLERSLKRAIFETDEEAGDFIALESLAPNLSSLRRYAPMIKLSWSRGIFEDMDQRYFEMINRCQHAEGLYSHDLLAIEKNNNNFSRFQEIFNSPKTKSYINKMINFDLKTLLPALLHVEDRTSMSFSLESRVPLLDPRVAQLAASIPSCIKLKNGISKYILKKAVKKVVPKEIMARRDKMGFPVPISEWFKNELNGFIKDILLSGRSKKRGIFNLKGMEKAITREGKFDRQIWGALCLELWFNNFIDK